jgi:flagellar hook-length control protein FliK
VRELAHAAPKPHGATEGSTTVAAPGWLAPREPTSATAAAAPAVPFHAQVSAAIDSPAFSSALSLQLTTLVSGDVSEARLHLHPAELGPIAVQIGLDGQMAQVHLAVEHSATRTALEQALPELARALQEAGFTMTGGGVSQQQRDPQAMPNAAPSSRSDRGGADDAPLAAVSAPVARRARGLLDVYA